MEIEEVRTIALSLPGTSEAPHFEKASFRVGTKIFATVPQDELHLNLLLEESEARNWAAEYCPTLQELWWGKKICGISIDLAAAPAELVTELVQTAWRRKAPKRMVEEFEKDSAGNN